MKHNKTLLEIQLLERKLQIKSPESKTEDLQKAVNYLNGKMREIRDNGSATSNENILILAALNITYELINAHKHKEGYLDALSGRIQELQTKIDTVIAESGAK